MDALPSFFSNWLVTSRLRIALATDGAWEPGNLWGLWLLLTRGNLQLLRELALSLSLSLSLSFFPIPASHDRAALNTALSRYITPSILQGTCAARYTQCGAVTYWRVMKAM